MTGGSWLRGPNWNAAVRSPRVWRRYWLMFVASTPVNTSRKRRIDVWSNRSCITRPPVVHGEIIRQGTRNPGPTGARCPVSHRVR